MAGYSRENKRQNDALQTILRGGTPEGKVQVGYTGKSEDRGDKIDRLSDIMKEARMPWFCPSCKKVMKHRLDDKTWSRYNHCFDCQVEFENKMRIDGTYDEWKESKIKADKLAWIKDQKQQIKELKEQKTPDFFNQVAADGQTLDKEKWNVNMEKIVEKADEYLEYLDKEEESLK
tara:strand:+ start:115 stop:639 length:525 start_codon:yes stop_codon:yes gene_type:complete